MTTYLRDASPLVVVSQLSTEQANQEFAQQAQALLLGAYATQFETMPPRLPSKLLFSETKPVLEPNTIKKNLFDPENPQFVSRYLLDVAKAMAGGSEYWVGHEPNGQQLVSLAKLSPSRKRTDPLQQLRLRNPNIFINDIDVDPTWQRIGIGTITLLHALDNTEITQDDGRAVALHAYKDSYKLNNWYSNMGLRQMKLRDPKNIGAHELSLYEWSTEGNSDLGGVKLYLRNKASAALIRAEMPQPATEPTPDPNA